ncbi:mitochondrial inner membrane protease subunit 1-like [Chelonus insularis]|uniref:mitochondrial inner membrane protease subunit 1-like n=1 Tax=Chelonus insularis TaxID=460826 RepID=UPI00158B15A5|nr:mitochondrial inner membrane protease subunit 1-like [Chelonus insularis]
MSFGVKFFNAIGTVIQYSCITHCILEYVGDFIVCTGPSMEPTLYSKDVIFTEHISHRLQRLKKGDIIIAKCPINPHQHICKRIIAVEGDKIRYGFKKYVVPPGHLWLEGDNRDNSTDSRLYGPVPQGLIRSRAVCKIWPLSDFTLFTHDD